MRIIPASLITETIRRLCIEANRNLPDDIACALRCARVSEPFAPAQGILDILVRNEQIARETQMPVCQDTGMAVVYAEVGQDVHIDGDFEAAVHEGVHRGYVDGLLRKSVVSDPLRRVNTGDNTPAIIHTRLVPGDRVKLTVAPKGFGSENMSRLAMLTPAQGVEGVKRFVEETVLNCTEEHDHDTSSYHFAVAETVGEDTADERHEVNEAEECAVDLA